MRLTYGFQINPGCCHVCRSSYATAGGGPVKVIDTDRDDLGQVKRYHVYLCENCVTAAYQMLDSTKELIGKQELADLRGENIALTNEVARLMDERDKTETMIARAVISGAVAEGASV